MFDSNEALPSNYGYAGEDPSQLSSLASSGGTLPSDYGEAKSPASTVPPKAPAPESTPVGYAGTAKKDPAKSFAEGLAEGLQTFQSSGRSSPPTTPPTESSKTSSSGDRWRTFAVLGVTTLVVGGGLVWWGSKKGWFGPNKDT